MNFWNLFIGISTFIVALITLVVILRSARTTQLNLLRGLYQHLDKIKESASVQNDYIQEDNDKIPSWTLINLDLNYYLSHINHTVKKEGIFLFESICTRELKQQIINVVDKTNTINNLFSILYMGESSDTPSAVRGKYKLELRNNTYYIDLNNFIENAQKQLRLILKKKRFCSKTYY